MPSKFGFTDYSKIGKPEEKLVIEWKDFVNQGTGKRGLRIRSEATHSAILNRNNRIYIPSRMADGVSTFRTGEKPTKILKHHNPDIDPVGVVRGARFVPTVPQELMGSPDVMNLMSSSTSIKDQLKSLRNLLKTGVITDSQWRGLGYIELIADIYDQLTIEQLSDGRFDAVSTNFRSPGATHCLICGQNWAKDGFCDHEMGESYEDGESKIPCLAIPGVHKYFETSICTFEADELVSIEIMDSVNAENNKTYFIPKDSLVSDNCSFEFKDFLEEDNMTDLTDNKDQVPEITPEEPVLSDSEKNILDVVKKVRPEIEDSKAIELSHQIVTMLDENGNMPEQADAEIDLETAIAWHMDSLEAGEETPDEALIYAEFEKELNELGLQDAVLSAETRNKMAESTFCGPGRSFPVPDCAHVTAARRLIGRYKGPGSKTSILACVSRKAKALGCSDSESKENEKQEDSITPEPHKCIPCAAETLKTLPDAELRTAFHAAEFELMDRKLTIKRECGDCIAREQVLVETTQKLADSTSRLTELDSELAALRHELKRAYADYTHQVDAFIERGLILRQAKMDKLALVGVLNKKYATFADANEVLKNQKDLTAIEAVICDGFNLDNVVEKLNDGMSRKPEGTITDPTQTNNTDQVIPAQLNKPEMAALENIRLQLKTGKIGDAHRIYVRMKSLGHFDNYSFEDMVALVEQEKTTK